MANADEFMIIPYDSDKIEIVIFHSVVDKIYPEDTKEIYLPDNIKSK